MLTLDVATSFFELDTSKASNFEVQETTVRYSNILKRPLFSTSISQMDRFSNISKLLVAIKTKFLGLPVPGAVKKF